LPYIQIGNDNFYEVLSKIRGPEAVAEWRQLQEVMRPLAKAAVLMPPVAFRWGRYYCVCGDVGREVIRLTHFQGDLTQGQGPYLLLTPYTHGVPHVDCEGPCAVTRTNLLLPPGRKAPETCPHQELNRV
jgi:hypothetical protein